MRIRHSPLAIDAYPAMLGVMVRQRKGVCCLAQTSVVRSEPRPARVAWGIAAFTAIAVAGLFYVKWDPLFHKSLAAAAHHTLGGSIVSGTVAAAPQPSLAAAWLYTRTYVGDVWQAMVLGLLLGAGVQALIPGDWLRRVLGRTGLGSVALAGLAATPSMM